MTARIITMNVTTREIGYTFLTSQELAELEAITDDYRRRFDSPHQPLKTIQRTPIPHRKLMPSRSTRVAVESERIAIRADRTAE